MKRSLLATVALVVGAAILAVGLLGARLMQTGPQEAAHAQAFEFAIDADPWNGTDPCNPIDDTNTVDVGADHQVAVCTVNEPEEDVNAFAFTLTYNPLLNQCKTNPSCTSGGCLDDNPDANAGSTLGSGVPTSPDLGTGWDCTGFGTTQPSCSAGEAKMDCLSTLGPYTSGGLSPFPLAVVTFTVLAGGTDTIVTLAPNVWSSVKSGELNPVSVSADVVKEGTPPANTATPTATATATPTATPCPNGICPTGTPTPRAWTKTPTPPPTGTPTPAEPSGPSEPPPPPPPPSGGTMPQVVPPGTGSGPDGTPWASTAAWLLAAAGAVSASLGGLYLRRAGHR